VTSGGASSGGKTASGGSGVSSGGASTSAGGKSAGSGGNGPDSGEPDATTTTGQSGPTPVAQMFKHPVGTSLANGQEVFRFETLGDEGYWTRVLELPQGVVANKITPAQALAAGLSVDIDAVPAAMKTVIAAQLAAADAGDPTSIPALQDPANTEALIEANAVIGVVTRKNHARFTGPLDGKLAIDDTDVFAGESVGISCALCHGATDGSVLSLKGSGTIGHRVDGRANHELQVGKIIALANHSVAYYPTLALDLVANNHGSVSRNGVGKNLIPAAPTEAQVDAYLNDDNLYPAGMFDDQPDGNGAPVHNTPLFRTELAAPWGSEGSIHFLQNFSNLVFSALLDPTDLLITAKAPNDPTDAGAAASTYSGPQYLEYEKAGPAGLELIANYKNIIEKQLGIAPYATHDDGGTDNNGYPYVGRPDGECAPAPAGVENEPSIAGLKCAPTKMLDMNAYLNSLRAPAGAKGNAATIASGRELFRQTCTSCHNDDQSKFVPEDIVAFNGTVELFANAPARPPLYPGYAGKLLATRPAAPFAGLVPVRDSVGIFDDKLIITEASNYGQPRGDALPLLMDLARKPSFLHDDEVKAATPTASLDLLLDPKRGSTAPHPFYIANAAQRATVVTFLQSLDDNPLP
jgi:mono/diheme cytochrome c family protein